ncbi:hypothetical protein VF21_03823 [Pseudogymnoascus sp. 05NY08]|nr:hypothetical protein VF21_03823 [Pseudogymnoascus sp. 05NY08]
MIASQLSRSSRSATAVQSVTRAFTTTAIRPKTPSLADVTNNGVDSFNAKQKEFRADLAAKQKPKFEPSQSGAGRFDAVNSSTPSSSSQSPTFLSEAPTAPHASTAGPVSNKLGLGKLSIAAEPVGPEGEKPTGKLSSLIYGTKEGREMDQQIEQSFSQVLARGKYVHSIVFHEVKPDKVDEYVELVGNWYPKMASMPENKVHLVGSWRTEVGDSDTFVHIWEYQKYDGYHSSLHSIANHPDFPAFDKKLKTLITSKRVSLMQEFSFWPTSPPRQLGGLFELRSYTLHPGNLLDWETHWRKGLKARREVMEGVGAWFVQIGDLNTVHHLWQFADLEERKLRREKSWGVEGWGNTVHKTVPLIQTMQSRILIPMPWSPVA